MDKRKELILNTIIKEHIRTGVPTGSEVLVNKYKLNISPATARNEMVWLENEGYIAQPHTSAGRIPTEKAYNFYIQNLKEEKINDLEKKELDKAFNNYDEIEFKQASKIMANFSGLAIFWAFHRHNLYYTGISNLLQQPEFMQSNLIYDISAVIDRVDEIIDDIFDSIGNEIQILVGSKNPFGNFCSTILVKYKRGDNIGMFGILGPIRMNYEKNMAIVKFVNEKINNRN